MTTARREVHGATATACDRVCCRKSSGNRVYQVDRDNGQYAAREVNMSLWLQEGRYKERTHQMLGMCHATMKHHLLWWNGMFRNHVMESSDLLNHILW